MRGLGDRRVREIALGLVMVGVIGKLVLLSYANVETVFVASLLAGSLLGRWYTVVVPLAVLGILLPLESAFLFPGYTWEAMGGIAFFVATGYLFVGVAGRRLKPRILCRVKSVALLTTISVPLTVTYDVWTDVGEWFFLTRRAGVGFWTVLQLQVPFTLIHILSSLIFVPIFGSLFLLALAHRAAAPLPEAAHGNAQP